MSSPCLRIPPIRILIRRCKKSWLMRWPGPLHEPHCLDQARTLRMKCLRMIGFALAASVAAGQANAEELTGTLKKIKETGTINIGYRDSSIPFSSLDDNQKPIGFAIDICYRIVDPVKS